MANPFEKRASEYVKDDLFLSVITPAPLYTYLEKYAREERLYDRLVMIVGTPGSGKTSIARLFQFRTIAVLLRKKEMLGYRDIVNALTKCCAMKEEYPLIVACRIPMEAEYREFRELPYPEQLKIGLMHKLIQARAVISWLGDLSFNDPQHLSGIRIVVRNDAHASAESIGGTCGHSVLEKAKKVERSIYEITSALVPPKSSDLGEDAIGAYKPFDVIESFQSVPDSQDNTRRLHPVVILDDAHTLHRDQLTALKLWLSRRELKLGRWILMRLDAQTTEEAVTGDAEEIRTQDATGRLSEAREITNVWLQSSDNRARQRQTFRRMAREMANKYLKLMEVFHREGVENLRDILDLAHVSISPVKVKVLAKKVNRFQSEKRISDELRRSLEDEVDHYFAGATPTPDGQDLRLAMLSILLHRYTKRVPQANLFEDFKDGRSSKPITANAEVADGARIHLLHEFDRPYYYGIDMLCDCCSENAELFLHLISPLMSAAETRLIRGSSMLLSPRFQDRELRKRAQEILNEWSFPEFNYVRQLSNQIALECLSKAKEPNASLGGGPNGFGIPQEEFDSIPSSSPRLARVLKYGVAYNALSLAKNHKTKGQLWCLIELCGPAIIANGLSPRRGNFLERKMVDLNRIIEG